MPTLNFNKPRLYMALYPIGNDQSEVKYHTALIFLPKNPNPSKKEGIMYHMRNGLDSHGHEVWYFERKEVYSRTHTLLSVALLGKVKRDIKERDLHGMLQTIPHRNGERCRHWTWEAITALGQAGVIETTDGQALWNTLTVYTDRKMAEFDPKKPVPALDNNGNEIESEIGPL